MLREISAIWRKCSGHGNDGAAPFTHSRYVTKFGRHTTGHAHVPHRGESAERIYAAPPSLISRPVARFPLLLERRAKSLKYTTGKTERERRDGEDIHIFSITHSDIHIFERPQMTDKS